MPRLHLLVEGQTEEVLAQRVFTPHLTAHGWAVSVSILATRRPAAGGKLRGGVQSWEKLRREVTLLLRSNFNVLTTMIDYYGFPSDAPGMPDRPASAALERVQHVERALAESVDDPRFVPHLTLHETEAWVFAAADALGDLLDDRAVAGDLEKITEAAGGPELINDHPATAPSRRLRARIPTYQKILHGPLCVEAIGLAASILGARTWIPGSLGWSGNRSNSRNSPHTT